MGAEIDGPRPGIAEDAPLLILRAEGAALLVLATAGFSLTGAPWWLYGALFLVPDLSFAGYLAGPRAGAAAYNALHSTLGPALLAGLGWIVGAAPPLLAVAAVWAAHVGFDRLLGYGLKYPTAFAHTHLGRIGRRAPGPR